MSCTRQAAGDKTGHSMHITSFKEKPSYPHLSLRIRVRKHVQVIVQTQHLFEFKDVPIAKEEEESPDPESRLSSTPKQTPATSKDGVAQSKALDSGLWSQSQTPS